VGHSVTGRNLKEAHSKGKGGGLVSGKNGKVRGYVGALQHSNLMGLCSLWHWEKSVKSNRTLAPQTGVWAQMGGGPYTSGD